jgi:DNA mismatch repair protein MutS
MMQQYLGLKARAGDALLLYRLGDFYELFMEDAELAAPLLDLVLTTRDRDAEDPVPMCGVPAHALEGYVKQLLAAGYAVAIADQVEDAKQAKGLVRRDIVEVATPGLVANPDRLDGSAANYLAGVVLDEGGIGFAYIDVSTGEFAASEIDGRHVLEGELDRIRPREVVAREVEKDLPAGLRIRVIDDASFDPAEVFRRVGSLPPGLDAESTDAASRAAAGIWSTVARLQPLALEQRPELRHYRAAERLLLDPSTRRHLELVANLQDGGTRGTLIEVLDQTRTAMGRRELERRLGEPLLEPEAIRVRHDEIEAWLEPDSRRRSLAQSLRGIGDLERILTRACLPGSGPRDLVSLRSSLRGLGAVHEIARLGDTAEDLLRDLEATLVEEPPALPRGEPYTGFVRDGVEIELDRIRKESEEGHRYMETLEPRERERTGIPTLKVRYHRAFGYMIQVPKGQLGRVPPEYRRKQTTVSGERFTTDELTHWEGLVLRARERAAAVESRVLAALRERVVAAGDRVRSVAHEVAVLDVTQSLATVAREHDYERPEVDRSSRIEIEGGRHPVVERFTPDGFVPNDTTIDPENAGLLILTGPNMAGKSTLLRQVALIVLLAQMGAFVPARRARIGVADRIFTRVGASDSLSTGESTFMVEMRETATILREATPRSLVILDEIGRGTSTFDGLSIAWAVAEYLQDTPGLRPRTLFATHYHELADLAQTRSGVRNFHFAVTERGDEIAFLRQLEPGAASRSYGIEVARRAGLPPLVVRRARELLANLEGGEFDERGRPRLSRSPDELKVSQLGLFEPPSDPVREALRSMEPESMTPIEALTELDRLKKLTEEDR